MTDMPRWARFPTCILVLCGLVTGYQSSTVRTRTAVAASPPIAGPNAPTGAYANGTLLPDGRLVTPSGELHDLGDFPLGLAISPDGTLAVAINSGQGSG